MTRPLIKVVFSTAVALLAFSSAAMADQWSKTWQINGKPELHVTTQDASIQMEAGSGDKIEASINTRGIAIGGDGVKVIEHQDGNVVELEIREPQTHFSFGNRSVNLTVRVPQNLTAEVHTGDGSIKLSGIGGSLRLNTGDGSTQGDDLNGSLNASSGDGSFRIRGRFDVLQLHTTDGSIDSEAESGSRMGSDWRIETGDGSIHLTLPRTLAADVELHTGDGSMHLDLPLTVQGSHDEHEIQGKLNGGGPMLVVRSGDGSISVSGS